MISRRRWCFSSFAFIAFTLLALFSSAASAKDGEGEIYALLVGVNDYAEAPPGSPYGAADLKGAVNDVALFKSLLINFYQVPDDGKHIKVLLDKSATHAAIAQAFSDHLTRNAKLNRKATFILYFSGHGSLIVDSDGDEGDGFDETLLAHDSRAAGGKDITDDEIETWLAALKQETNNIALVIDSCHSGTISKQPPSSILSRRAPVIRNANDALPKGALRDATSINDADRAYSIITGSLADEVSNEGPVEIEDGKQEWHGFLTYSLVRVLQRDPTMSYLQAVKLAERGVQLYAPSQHPQAEGDVDRQVFGGIGTREDPFAPVSAINGDVITVEIGSAHGIQSGALLAIYDQATKQLSGEKGKIAEAQVEDVGIRSSTARVVGTPRSTVTTTSKAKVISPYASNVRIPVAVASPPAELQIGGVNPIGTLLEERLRNNPLLRLEKNSASAVVSVEISCVQAGQIIPVERTQSLSGTCQRAYYLSPRDQVGALYGFFAVDDGKSADAVVAVLEKFARQQNLKNLYNGSSPLNGGVKFRIARVEVKSLNGVKTPVKNVVVQDSTVPVFKVGEYFRFFIRNESDQTLYFSIIGLGTSGSVFILGDALSGEKILAGGEIYTKPARKIGRPLGVETYVLLVTTSPINVRSLENAGVKARAPGPLGSLLYGLTSSIKDSEPATELDLDSWATVRLDIDVR